MSEKWKSIPGYETRYNISTLGRVKALAKTVNCRAYKKRNVPEKILKPGIRKDNVMHVSLVKDAKATSFTVHRLVTTAFLPNPDNKPQVNHIDGDRTNNKLSNLEWCTCKENVDHSWRTGLSKHKGSNNYKAKLTEAQVKYIKSSSESNASLSRMFNVARSTIWSIKNERSWRHVNV